MNSLAPAPKTTTAHPDTRVRCPDCDGTSLVIFGHPNDPHHLEAPCNGCVDGTIDLDEAADRGLL